MSSRRRRTTARSNGSRTEFGLDELASENLTAYLEDQRDATGVVPDDRTIVVERFPDELGDWRVCVLSPFGARVHAPWAMAIEARMSEHSGLDVQVLWSDDGIAIRLPESEERIPVEDLLFDPEDVERLVVERLPATAMFTTVFREAAARALLLPAARRAAGPRSGSSDAAAPTCSRWRRSTRPSRSCSRRRGRSCATCSTCPR